MATWLVPVATQSELDAITSPADGDLVFNTDTDEIQVGANGSYVTVGPSSGITYTADSVITSDSMGNALAVTLPADTVLARNSNNDAYEAVKITNALIDDNTIGIAKLERGSGNEVVITDASGNVSFITMTQGTLLARGINGDITPQKLTASMIDDNTIPHSKLADIQPGQVLGILPDETGTAVEAIDISDFAGNRVTSSISAPLSPNENDLWYYCGEQNGDNARLYIYQNGIWLDAAPAIVNTDPGPQGDPGPAGEDGTSVELVVLQDRNADEDVVFEFYSSSEVDADSLISTVTLPIEDITFESGLPSAPDPVTDDTGYVLKVPASGPVRWTAVTGTSGLSISMARDVGSYTVTSSDISAGVALVLDLGADFGFTAGTELSAAHIVTFNGFVLNSTGNDVVDYSYSTTNNTITIAQFLIEEVFQENDVINLTNFRAILS